jgi:hypothetical protein
MQCENRVGLQVNISTLSFLAAYTLLTNKTGRSGPVLPVAPQRRPSFQRASNHVCRWIVASVEMKCLVVTGGECFLHVVVCPQVLAMVYIGYYAQTA